MSAKISVLAAAKKDHQERTSLQLYISTVDQDEEKYITNASDSIELVSPFHYSRKVVPYSSICREQIKCDNNNYPVKEYQHYLRFIYLTLPLPKLSVLPEYEDIVEIAWTRNLFHSIIGKGIIIEFLENEKLLFTQKITRERLDDHRATEVKDIQWYDQDIGNRPELIEWNTELFSEDELALIIPFFFSKRDNLAIPIYKISSGTPGVRVVFKCDFELDINKLLRMRIRSDVNSKWINIPVPELPFLDLGNDHIKKPKLWVEYSILDEEELVIQVDDTYKVLITDYIYNEDVKVKSDDAIEIPLNHENQSIKCIKFFAENYKSTMYNNYSNYTTNHLDIIKGTDPVKNSSIKYNSIYRVLPLSSVHTSRITRRAYFRGRCSEKGYHAITFSYNPSSSEADVNSVPDKSAELIIRLKGTAISGKSILEDKYKNMRKTYIDREWDRRSAQDKIKRIIEYLRKHYPGIITDDSVSYKYIIKSHIYVVKTIEYKRGMIEIST